MMMKKRTIKVFFPFGCLFPILPSLPSAGIADVAPAVTIVMVVVDVAAEDLSGSPATALAAVSYPSAVSN
jgi:hypothetical protein